MTKKELIEKIEELVSEKEELWDRWEAVNEENEEVEQNYKDYKSIATSHHNALCKQSSKLRRLIKENEDLRVIQKLLTDRIVEHECENEKLEEENKEYLEKVLEISTLMKEALEFTSKIKKEKDKLKEENEKLMKKK